MSPSPYVIAAVCASLGAVPFAALTAHRARGRQREAQYWWLAAAFGVSALADLSAFFLAPRDRFAVSLVYPISQVALVAMPFLLRRDVLVLLIALSLVGAASLLWRGVTQPDILLRTSAFLTVVGIVVDRWQLGRLRTALLVYFGLGWVTWLGVALWPGWTSYLVNQTVRATGICLFCWATLETGPDLRVQRGAGANQRSRIA